MTNNVNCVEELVENDGCTGCAGCASLCHCNAIDMMLSPEGFYRPVVKDSICTGCGACVKKCPVLAVTDNAASHPHWSTPRCFAAWSADADTQLGSSSGGVFSEISNLILEQGGSVFGCSWNDKIEPEHIEITTCDEIASLRGSKYVPSAIGTTLTQVISRARSGRKVLFSGTPCQVAALDQLLDTSTRNNVSLVDFICHGVPSLTLFTVYKRWLFGGESISSFTFRNKSLCLQTIVARTPSGKTYTRRASDDPFFRLGYGSHLSMMKSCFTCKFAGLPRRSDVTLGDYWGVPKDLDHPGGVSAILVNTPRGEKLIAQTLSAGCIKLIPTELAAVAKMNPRATGGEWPLNPLRDGFLRDVAQGRTFRWLYWKWYLPTRVREQMRDALCVGVVTLCRKLHLTDFIKNVKKSIAFGNAH
jgi:coenzyme F420-reducing hydrogenase beta subunit